MQIRVTWARTIKIKIWDDDRSYCHPPTGVCLPSVKTTGFIVKDAYNKNMIFVATVERKTVYFVIFMWYKLISLAVYVVILMENEYDDTVIHARRTGWLAAMRGSRAFDNNYCSERVQDRFSFSSYNLFFFA